MAGHPRDRAGVLRKQPGGFHAFIPSPFPPTDLGLADLAEPLERATLAVGRLVGSAEILPDPDLFVIMYVAREAVLSSQIEGTEASLVDLLEYEARLERDERHERHVDVRDINNYVGALRYGLERARDLPLSLRLIREIHGKLMTGVRGGEPSKTPGDFRRSQNWSGGPSPATARFVPPPVLEMHDALGQLEAFLHADSDLPILIRVALAHAQFETIHLEGVAEVSSEATFTARQIVGLREELRNDINEKLGRRTGSGLQLLEHLFRHPIVSVRRVTEATGLSQPAANALTNAMAEMGILRETTGRRTHRLFAFERYLLLFHEKDDRR